MQPRERPRPEIGAVARAVTLSVPDLERSRRFFADVLGLPVAEGLELHRPEHEALWGLEGRSASGSACGRTTSWSSSSRTRTHRGPWPEGYRISDLGLLNIAFGFRERADFDAACRRCAEAGVEGNGPPLHLGAWSVIYVNDDQGFSVELLHVEPWYEGQMGFRPRSTPRLAPFAGGTPARRLRPSRKFGKAIITGAAGGIGTELARLAAEDGTSLVLMDREGAGLSSSPASSEAGQTSPRSRSTSLISRRLTPRSPRSSKPTRTSTSSSPVRVSIAPQSLLAFDWRQAQDDFKVNTLANLVLLSHLVPAMADGARARDGDREPGRALGLPYEAAYSGSKAALATIADSARAELEPRGITFTAVFPGFVDTPMFRANAFKHTYSLTPRDAAERIYVATLQTPRAPRLSRDRVRQGPARVAAPGADPRPADPQRDEPAAASDRQRIESRP